MSFTWQGVSSDAMKFNITQRKVYNAPAFDVNAVEVPGRSGDLLNSQNRFRNKDVVYTGYLRSRDFSGSTPYEKLSNGLRALKAWLLADAGTYHDIADDYDPGYVRHGYVQGETSIEEVFDRPFGATINVTFRCKPFMYKEGEEVEIEPKTVGPSPIASFSDGAEAPLKSLTFGIEPQQDLHGYANPWPAGGGINLLLPRNSDYSGAEVNGVTITYSKNTEQFAISGTNTKTDAAWLAYNFDWNTFEIGELVVGETLYFSHNLPTGAYSQITYRDANNVAKTLLYLAGNGTFHYASATIPNDINYIERFQIGFLKTAGNVTTANVCFEVSRSVPTQWSPYSNICPISGTAEVDGKQSGEDMTDYTPITIDLSRTVYGGTVDVLNGKMTLTHKGVDMGSLTWTYNSQYTRFQSTGISDAKLPPENNIAWNAIGSRYRVVAALAVAQTNGTFGMLTSATLLVHDDGYTDAASFKTAVTGQTIVYELATPLEYDLTPVSVNSLLGQNNIWHDAGETEVEYVGNTPLENPTGFTSQPFITIEMTDAGNLIVNGKVWEIGEYSGTLYCDSENMDWYDSTQLQNDLVSGEGFPELDPGENIVSYTGGINKLTIDPRWKAL